MQSIFSHRLFRREQHSNNAWQIIRWWEARRIPYNLIVGFAGIISMVMCFVSSIIGEKSIGVPIGMPDPPIIGIFAAIAYGIMANVCFTWGWIVELAAVRPWEDKAEHFGPICFRLGTLFSVVLTLLPGRVIVSILHLSLLSQ